MLFCFFLFFKQKTAYEMRISDWSSDVCSSDLFWCNRRIIENALEHGDLWVIRRGVEAVAVQVGDYAADIVSVRKDCRRQGLGDALFAASLQRAMNDNVNVLSIECSPRSSWTFWQRHGFERYGDLKIGRASCRERVCQYV